MKPVYVCQLPQAQQQEIEKMLEGLILHGCGGSFAEVENCYGISLAQALQNGMDSKIVDLDYLMVFYSEDFQTEKANDKFRLADVAVISSILKEARKHDNVPDFVYPNGRIEEQAPSSNDEWER